MDSEKLQKLIYLLGGLLAAAAILLFGVKILSENLETGKEYQEKAHLSEAALDEIQHNRGR